MSVAVNSIDLKQIKQSICRLQICQLNSSDFDWSSSDGLNYLEYNDKISQKVFSLLNVAKQTAVDLLVFPELSIPVKLVEKLQEWSKEHGIMIVCGSHYHK